MGLCVSSWWCGEFDDFGDSTTFRVSMTLTDLVACSYIQEKDDYNIMYNPSPYSTANCLKAMEYSHFKLMESVTI